MTHVLKDAFWRSAHILVSGSFLKQAMLHITDAFCSNSGQTSHFLEIQLASDKQTDRLTDKLMGGSLDGSINR